MSRSAHLVVVLGPTASGKSDLALSLARRLGGEIVNADAVQVYRGMDVGSAKTPPEQRAGVPHHLLDVLDVRRPTSVAAFQRDARAAIEDCLDRGVTPILTGGSSLYVRAAIDDFAFPGTDPALRAALERRLAEEGNTALHAELARVAPHAAEEILPSNGRRLVRALEVTQLTGWPFEARLPEHVSIYRPVTLLGLQVPRDVLDERIARRVERMCDDGLVAEVRALLDEGLADSPTASRALGYQQVIAQLAGECTEEEARAATVKGTSAFARRQDRLFRRDPRVRWLPWDAPDLLERALAAIEEDARAHRA